MQLRDDALSSLEVVWKMLEHRLGDKAHYWNDFAVSRAPALLLGSLFVLIAFCVIPRRWHASERSVISRNTESGSRLAALSAIVAPTRSFWPPTFVDIARRSDKVVRIPLELLLDECLSGRVSLRSRGDELSRLLNGSLAVRGRPIRLDVGAEGRLRVATWGGVQATWLRKKTVTLSLLDTPVQEATHIISSPFPDQYPAHDLDRVEDAELTPIIHSLRTNSLSSDVKLAFTTRGPSVSPQVPNSDPRLVFAALPFLPREHATPAEYKRLVHFRPHGAAPIAPPYHLDRSSSVLERTLLDVLGALQGARVVSTRDVSEEHAVALEAYASALETDVVRRTEFVEAWGEKGLLEEAFYARWEAALLRAGLLARYVVVVNRQAA